MLEQLSDQQSSPQRPSSLVSIRKAPARRNCGSSYVRKSRNGRRSLRLRTSQRSKVRIPVKHSITSRSANPLQRTFVHEEGFWEGSTSESLSSSRDCSPDCPGPSPSAGL